MMNMSNRPIESILFNLCNNFTDAETGESGENDDKMDVRSDIEGQMQERGSAGILKMLQTWLERVD